MSIERPISGDIIPDGWFGDLYDLVQSKTVFGDGRHILVTSDATGQHITWVGDETQSNIIFGDGTTTAVPIASLGTVGIIMPDGTSTWVDSDGTLHAQGGGTVTPLPVATDSTLGGVKASDDVHVSADGTMTVPMLGTISNAVSAQGAILDALSSWSRATGNAPFAIDGTSVSTGSIPALASPDFNDCTNTGVWLVTGTPSHAPSAWGGVLEVYHRNGSGIGYNLQRYTAYSAGSTRVFERYGNGGWYGSWVELTTDIPLTAIVAGSTNVHVTMDGTTASVAVDAGTGGGGGEVLRDCYGFAFGFQEFMASSSSTQTVLINGGEVMVCFDNDADEDAVHRMYGVSVYEQTVTVPPDATTICIDMTDVWWGNQESFVGHIPIRAFADDHPSYCHLVIAMKINGVWRYTYNSNPVFLQIEEIW